VRWLFESVSRAGAVGLKVDFFDHDRGRRVAGVSAHRNVPQATSNDDWILCAVEEGKAF
jgi:hypothetical protein